MQFNTYLKYSDIKVELVQVCDAKLLDRLYAIDISVHTHPWSYDNIKQCFDIGQEVLVLYVKNHIQGFSVISTVLDEAELLTIGVSIECRGQGLGEYLLTKTIEYVINKQCHTIFLEVAANNIKAINLYKKLGFIQVGLRRNYYPKNSQSEAQDALVMSLQI